MSWLIFFGINFSVYIVLSHAHFMRVPCNRRHLPPSIITKILRKFIPASQYNPYFRSDAHEFDKNYNFLTDGDKNFGNPEVSLQLLAGGSGIGTVGPHRRTLSPGLETVGPGLGSVEPQVGTVGLGLGTAVPELGTAAVNKIQEDHAKTLRCAQLPCPADELGPPVCACNYVTGKVVTFKDMCDVKRHNCRYDTVFKVIINAICPWDFTTRRTIGKPFIDYSDSKYYN